MSEIGYDQSKYALIRGEDWFGHTPGVTIPRLIDPDTYFVLRQGDLGSRLALGAYKEGLLLELDLLRADDPRRVHLLKLADGVSDLLDRWHQQGDRKIPD